MRAFGALRGFNIFGKSHFARNQRRQKRNKASQSGSQPLSSTSSTQVVIPLAQNLFISALLRMVAISVDDLFSPASARVPELYS